MLSRRRADKPDAAGCFLLERKKKQIPRSSLAPGPGAQGARNDTVGGFFSSLLSIELEV